MINLNNNFKILIFLITVFYSFNSFSEIKNIDVSNYDLVRQHKQFYT